MNKQKRDRRGDLWTDSDLQMLRKLWPSRTAKEVASKLHRHTRRSTLHKAQELELKRPKEFSPRRIHHPNGYFWRNQSPSLAYLLGLLTADGNICESSNHHTLQLTLKRSDESLLRKIKSLAGGYVGRAKTVKAFYWRLSGIEFIEMVKRFGLKPRKTQRTAIPPLEKNLYRHFIRGYFDGDGTLGIYRVQRGRSFRLSFFGCKPFLSRLSSLIIAQLGPVGRLRHICRKLYGLHYSRRNEVACLASWMYTNCSLFLTRKNLIAKKIVEQAQWA